MPRASGVQLIQSNQVIRLVGTQPLSCLTFKTADGLAARCVLLLTSLVYQKSDLAPISVGGAVRQIAWDPSGERVAISFEQDCPGCECVAIFIVKYSPSVELSHMFVEHLLIWFAADFL